MGTHSLAGRDVMLFRNVSCTKAAQVTQGCPFMICSNSPAPKLAEVSPVLRAIYSADTDLCICISFKCPSTEEPSTNDARKPQPPSQCSKPGPQPRFEAIPGVSILSREELQKSLPRSDSGACKLCPKISSDHLFHRVHAKLQIYKHCCR